MGDQLGLMLTDATRVDSGVFGLSQQSFARVLFSSARFVCLNSEYLFIHCGIFYKNFWSNSELFDLGVVR